MDDVNRSLEAPETRVPVRGVRPRPQSRWRRSAWIGWIALFLLAVAGVVYWVQTRPAQQAPTGRFQNNGPLPVVAAPVEKGDVPILVSALGTVTPLNTVTVRTQIAGQLVRVNFQEGQEVKQGDLLAEIDSRPYINTLNQLQGQLSRDQALLNDAKIDLARYRTLVAQDSIARQQYDTQQYLVHQYEGTVMADQAQVDNAKLNIEYCRITAPVAGRVGLRQVDPGNYVQTNDTNGIVVITQRKPITAIFTVPEDQLPAILKRVAAGATLPVTAFDRAGVNKLATGKLSTVDNQIDTATGTVKLRALFANEDETLFPNQFVNIQLQVDVLANADVVPVSAIQRGAPGTFVYVVNADNTVKMQPVKLGPSEGERVALLSGVEPGMQVVTDGADKLRDGGKVTVQARATGTAATPAGGAPGVPAGSAPAEGAAAGAPAAGAPAPSTTGSPQPGSGNRRRGNNRP